MIVHRPTLHWNPNLTASLTPSTTHDDGTMTTVRARIIKRWCKQILDALHYLHNNDPPIIHRDLK